MITFIIQKDKESSKKLVIRLELNVAAPTVYQRFTNGLVEGSWNGYYKKVRSAYLYGLHTKVRGIGRHHTYGFGA